MLDRRVLNISENDLLTCLLTPWSRVLLEKLTSLCSESRISRIMTISFVISVHPSVCMEQLGSHCFDFLDIFYINIYRKFVQKIQVSLKSDKNNGVPYIEVCIRL
jgi:hypothetical protein